MPEVKIDGQNVEATVEGEGKTQIKEETKVEAKKSGKLKKIAIGLGTGLLAVGATAVAVLKILAMKDSAPELNSTSEPAEEYSSSDAE